MLYVLLAKNESCATPLQGAAQLLFTQVVPLDYLNLFSLTVMVPLSVPQR